MIYICKLAPWPPLGQRLAALLDNREHLGSERVLDFLSGRLTVLDHVVQERGDRLVLIPAGLKNDRRDRKQMTA
jgi:hypothetical protein